MFPNPPTEPNQAEVQREAYLLYLASGCVPGRDLENWLAAQALLVGRRTFHPLSEVSIGYPTVHFPLNANLSRSPFGAENLFGCQN